MTSRARTLRQMSASRVGRVIHNEAVAGYVFLLPWLVGLLALTLTPMIASLYLSFTEYNFLSAPTWVGLENYLDLIHDRRYLSSVRVTTTYVFLAVPLKLAFALLLAVGLNRGLRGLPIYRALYYVPSLLGASVAIAILWRQLFSGNGLVNSLLARFGWVDAPDWISTPSTALYTLVLLAVWEFGSPMIIFLAGLRQIPQELYEAARVDGAKKWRQFTHITIPMLTPLIFFNLVLQIIGAFQAFTQSYVVSGGTGGPLDSTLFYTLYLYQEAFGSLRMGYGSAMAWVLLLGIGTFTAILFGTSRFWVFTQDR